MLNCGIIFPPSDLEVLTILKWITNGIDGCLYSNRLIYLKIFLVLLNSCGSLSDAGKVLRNEKINNTDEFLVKKRDPLTLPPDYETIPKPGSLKNKNKTDESGIDKILKIPDESVSNNKSSSSTEQSILNRIKKWKTQAG